MLVTVTLTTGEAEAVLHALDLLANVRLMANKRGRPTTAAETAEVKLRTALRP